MSFGRRARGALALTVALCLSWFVPALGETTGTEDVNVVTLKKNGVPFLLVDLYPEWGVVKNASRLQKEAFVLRRCVTLAVDKGLATYPDDSDFRIKVILIENYDEYNNPIYDNAKVLGNFELEKKVLQAINLEMINSLSRDEIAKLFKKVEFAKGPW